MELVSSRDKFPLLEKMILVLKKFIRSPSLLSPMWQKLPYICNNNFYYNNLSITFLNYRTIKKSPSHGHVARYIGWKKRGWVMQLINHPYRTAFFKIVTVNLSNNEKMLLLNLSNYHKQVLYNKKSVCFWILARLYYIKIIISDQFLLTINLIHSNG